MNWDQVGKLTDGEIEKAAKDDPDSALPTGEELKKFKHIKSERNEK